MKIQILVTVHIGKVEDQKDKEFEREDAKAFVPYLQEKIEENLADSWQYNAKVNSVTTKRF